MRMVVAISATSAVLGYTIVHFAFFAKSTPATEPETTAVQTSAEPVVLANVVEVTDTDLLLDPAPSKVTGVPFDTTEPNEFTVPTSAKPIPPAADEDEDDPDTTEVAPMPRAVSARPALDSHRVAWYGSLPIPRQLNEALIQQYQQIRAMGFYF
ncbi:unnamed protein product [Gemmata massiliana]|uniref:Uncharacterized protein n=1 Tax=Gemmata massiliana TaxID=1210884 RepID=A0A6P2CQD1_9BACT|nr:hypothetical protein [Gemmata massiliana]VTR90777.1 unnamed protein product [Gemmata massiliana]